MSQRAANEGKELTMGHPVLTLELPEDVYERVRRAAKAMNQPVEKALVKIVRAATPSLEGVPARYRAELEAMETLAMRTSGGSCGVARRRPSSVAWNGSWTRTSAES